VGGDALVGVRSFHLGPNLHRPTRAVVTAIAILTGLLVGQTVSSIGLFQPTRPAVRATGPPPAAKPASLNIEDAGNGRVKIHFPPGTAREVAASAGASADLTLIDGDAATGIYLFDLPRVEVEMVDDTTALVHFPSIAGATGIQQYLAENHLTVIRWIRDRADSDGGRTVLVRLPVTNVVPNLVDRSRGIFEVTLATGLDQPRVLSWAAASGFTLLSYDPVTGKARVAPIHSRRVISRSSVSSSAESAPTFFRSRVMPQMGQFPG